MALANFEVERVVRWRNFQNSRPELGIDSFVSDDGKFFARERAPCVLADKIGIAPIAGMRRHRRIGHDRFRPRGGDFNEAAGLFRDFIANVVKASLLRLGNDLFVGQRSLRRWVPVDHATAAIDQTLAVKIDKNLLDSLDVMVIERVALARPIARAAKALQLFDDDATMLVLPFQDAAQEFIAA